MNLHRKFRRIWRKIKLIQQFLTSKNDLRQNGSTVMLFGFTLTDSNENESHGKKEQLNFFNRRINMKKYIQR